MVRSVRALRPLLILAFVAAATAVAGTGTARAAMLAGDGFAREIRLEVGGTPPALWPARTIDVSTSDEEDPPFLCRMVPTTTEDD